MILENKGKKMYKDIFEVIESKVKFLEDKGVLRGKKIFVGPVNYESMYLINFLKLKGYEVEGVISNGEYQNWTLLGIKVNALENIMIPFVDNAVILLTDVSNEYLNRKLNVLEYYYNVHRFVVIEPLKECKLKRIKIKIKDKFWRYSLRGIHRLFNGYKAYKKIRKTNKTTNIFLFPYASIGDIYILGSYMKKKALIFEEDFVLVVVGKMCQRLAGEMGFENVFFVNQSEMEELVLLKDVFSDELPDISILHYNYSRLGIAENISNYKKINFYLDYEYLLFGEKLEGFYRPEEKNKDIDKYCEDNGIVKGKSVILAPYAKSIISIPIIFWEGLANELSKRGYFVFTNCAKDSELAIFGTKRIIFPLEIANSVIEYAGYFIGLRSGLCDLISCSNSRKIIVYPKKKNYNMSIKEFYSLENIKGVINIKEIEFADKITEEDIDKVVSQLQF